MRTEYFSSLVKTCNPFKSKNKNCHNLANIFQILMVIHIHTLFELIGTPYKNQLQTLNIKIDRVKIRFREYSITLLRRMVMSAPSSGSLFVRISVLPTGSPSVHFPHFSFMLWYIELKFYLWLCLGQVWVTLLCVNFWRWYVSFWT